MKVIEKYEAIDGSVFDDKQSCIEYDSLCNQVEEILKKLKPQPKDDECKFANGGGYIQQNTELVSLAKYQILQLGIKYLKLKDNMHWGWIGRWFDDSNVSCLYSAWGRIECIDSQGREWGQPYYAIHPNMGKQIEYKEK